MNCTRRLSFFLWHSSAGGSLGRRSHSSLPVESGNLWIWSSRNLATDDFGMSHLWVFWPVVRSSRELESALCVSELDSGGALCTL